MASDRVFSRVDHTWLDRDEYERRKAEREERWFQRQMNQGQLACPAVISDTLPVVQSMVTGRYHDSKSKLRQEYRDHGMIEVGNDSSLTSGKRKVCEPTQAERDAKRAEIKATTQRAFAAVDTMSDDTIKRRRFERDGVRSEA